MAQPFNKPPRVKSSVPGSFTKNRVPRDAERTPSVKDIEDPALVGPDGKTVYLFEGDKSGISACSGACAAAWPPVTVSGTPRAGSGVNQALLVTIKRPNGTTQLAYHGHPLYYFTADTAAGTAHGQGLKAFGSDWYVINASGSEVDTS